MSSSVVTRYRLDDLRRLGTLLASAVGVAPARASALATQLLWFDAAGASSHGMGTLPDWLERIDRHEIDPRAEGRPRLEHAGTGVFDGQNGLAPLALAKAAGVASEKARDVGIGMVRVANLVLAGAGSNAAVAAELAVGPFVVIIAGPGPSLTIALPMSEGLPAIYDSALDRRSTTAAPATPLGFWSPWVSALTGGGADGTMILALAVPAMEPLTTFHDRVAASFGRGTGDDQGWLAPSVWEATRREAREHGVSLDNAATIELRRWSDRLGVAWPSVSMTS